MNMNTQKYKHLLRNKDGKAITVVITIIVLLFVAITIAVGVAVFLYNNNSQAYNMSSTDKIYYELKEGASVDSIAQDLDDQGIIGNPFWFKLRAKFTHMDSGIKPGIYGLSASMKADELLRIMNSGVSEVNVINILPGDTTKKIMQSVVAAGIMTEEQFWDLVKNGEWDYDFLEGAPKDETRLEGFLYPDEYTFVFETEPVEVIRKMLDTFASKWTPEMYNQAASMGKSVRDVVIEASLIERETFTKSEYPIIASVINNRINAGMRLQIDATIQYILPEPKEQLSIADTQISSPYNTYLNRGLPKGPICNPRVDCMEAVLNPESTNYVYYVLDASLDGHHNFAATYDEHLTNKADYEKALQERDS